MRRISAARLTGAVLLATTLVLAGCSGDDPTEPEESGQAGAVRDVVDEFTQALTEAASDGSNSTDSTDSTDGTDGTDSTDSPLAAVPYAGKKGAAVAADYDDVVAGMDGTEPTVAATDIEAGDQEAAATLEWSWPVVAEDTPWTYESTVDLVVVDGEWAVAWKRSVVEPSLTGNEVLDAITSPADRGDITGAGGEVLVTERPVLRFGIDRTRVPAKQAPASARALAELVGIDVKPYVEAVRASGDRAFVEAIVYRRGEVPQAVLDGYEGIRGTLVVSDRLALAPTREFAAPILGRVGPVTAEMIEEDPDRYQVGDVAGISGLQARYDAQLAGSDGRVVEAVREDSTARHRELFRVDTIDGNPLALTLDAGLQTTAEDLLADVGPASALVAIRPSTGAILVAANGPGTDGQNYATYGQFAPGSTFKIVSSLALLRAGLTPDSPVTCSPTITVDGKEFGNYSGYPSSALGEIPLRTAVAQSCNTAFISQRGALGRRDLVDAAASLGLGVDHDLGFPAYFGSVEPPAGDTEAAADLIGQGTVLASPMAMATVMASVQEGDLVVPRLVRQVEVTDHDHDPLTPKEADQLRQMLRQVVTEGSGAALADVPGPPVIAKTGTAEFQGDGLQTHAWMVAAQGDLAVAVFVDVGESGSQTAGPILESFLRAAG